MFANGIPLSTARFHEMVKKNVTPVTKEMNK